jgi:hypothetical protein
MAVSGVVLSALKGGDTHFTFFIYIIIVRIDFEYVSKKQKKNLKHASSGGRNVFEMGRYFMLIRVHQTFGLQIASLSCNAKMNSSF